MRSWMASPLLLTAFMATALPAAAETPGPAPMEPNSAWQMDYSETECHMVRRFGTGTETAMVQINRDGPLSPFNLAVMASALPDNADRRDAQLRFDGDKDWISALVTQASAPNGEPFFAFPQLPARFWETLNHRFDDNVPLVLRLRIGKHEVAFNLQRMKALKGALDTCEDSLLQSWGMDGAAIRSARQLAKPVGSPDTWLAANDFPAWIAKANRSALLLLWLGIDETGKVNGCRVIDAVGDASFRKTTCEKLTERARYEPALSSAGTPIKSYAIQRVNWISLGGSFGAAK